VVKFTYSNRIHDLTHATVKQNRTMPDCYIRTPDQDESRGPFDPIKLQTLAEAGQISENSLYYDESKEEWVPIALNPELCAQVFPQREKLELKIQKSKEVLAAEEAVKDPGGHSVEDMLDAAEGNTAEKKALKQKEKSFNKAAALSAPSLGIMMMASAVFLLYPHYSIILDAIQSGTYASPINFPFILIGIFDFMMGIFLFLAVTEVYPLLRGRSMLTLGFGAYVGWSLGDPILMLVSALSGLGIFLATIAQRQSIMYLAIVIGIGGNGFLAYLAVAGRFTGFFEGVQFDILTD
jgi:hypothetical protein